MVHKMKIKVIIRHYCPDCGTQLFIITDDPDIFHCEKCDKDYMRGDVVQKKEVIPNA